MRQMLVMLFLVVLTGLTVNANYNVSDTIHSSATVTAICGDDTVSYDVPVEIIGFDSEKDITLPKKQISMFHALYLVEKMMSKPKGEMYLTAEEGDGIIGMYFSDHKEAFLILDTTKYQQRLILIGHLPLNNPPVINWDNFLDMGSISYPVGFPGKVSGKVFTKEEYDAFIKEHPAYR